MSVSQDPDVALAEANRVLGEAGCHILAPAVAVVNRLVEEKRYNCAAMLSLALSVIGHRLYGAVDYQTMRSLISQLLSVSGPLSEPPQ